MMFQTEITEAGEEAMLDVVNSDIGGVATLVLILVLAFAIDRVVRAVLFVLSFIAPWARLIPDPAAIEDSAASAKAEKRQRLAYYAIAAALGLLVVAMYGNIRVFGALGYEQVKPLFDAVATGIILVAGSDFISRLLQISGIGGASSSSSQPLEITGKITLENGPRSKDEG